MVQFCNTYKINRVIHKGDKVYSIVNSEYSNSFNSGKWIKWSPESTGSWEIKVLAYLSAADHDSEGGGNRIVHYENLEYGRIIHCFYYAERGKLWDIKSIFVDVKN